MQFSLANFGDNSVPAIVVQGAFSGGGAANSTTNNRWEVTNSTTYTRGSAQLQVGRTAQTRHGVRLRKITLAGTYSFFGGTGPELDADDQRLAAAVSHSGTARVLQNLVYPGAAIRALGGASQFSLSAGVPALMPGCLSTITDSVLQT